MLITAGVVLVLLSAVFLLINKNDSEFAKIEKDYAKLRERMEGQGEKGIEVDFRDEYARLFTRISEGDTVDAKDYAQLVRTITQGAIEFEDEEVFNIAENVAKVYNKMAEGFSDFGVQQIKLVEDNSGKRLVIDYIGDHVDFGGYSIRKMDKDEDEKVYLGEQLVEVDGSSGENRIEIMIYGTASNELYNMYPSGTVHKLKGVPIELNSDFKIRIAPVPGFSGFAVYIGSDEPVNISEQDYTSINSKIIGSIDIRIF